MSRRPVRGSRCRFSPSIAWPLLLALLPPPLLGACAQTVKERMDQLSQKKSAECVSDWGIIADADSTSLSAEEWREGALEEARCTSLLSRRSSWQTFRFVAEDTRADLEIRSRVSAGGLAFGGEHSMIFPQVTLFEGSRKSSASVRLLTVRFDNDPGSEDALVFLYSMTGLKPDRETGVLVTADLSNAGRRIETAAQSRLAGGGRFEQEIRVGPFGPFEIRLKRP